MNQLYRYNTNKIISGVCGGLAEHLSVSPDVVRILFVIGTLISKIKYGFIIYIVAMILMPEAPVGYENYNSYSSKFSFDSMKNKNIIGVVLIAFGFMLTLKRLFSIDDILITSIILIALGVYILVRGGKEK